MNPLFEEDELSEEAFRKSAEEQAILAAKRQRIKNVQLIAKEIQESSLKADTIVASSKPVGPVEIEPPKEIYRHYERKTYQVGLPKDLAMKKSIDRLAGRVIRHGVKEEEAYGKVDGFQFLQKSFDDEVFRYYKWRVLAGIEEDFQWWNRQPVQVNDTLTLVPPPLPPFSENIESLEDDFAEEEDEDDAEFEVSLTPQTADSKELAFQKWLAKEWARKLRGRFENVLRQLSMERDSIAHAMKFSIDHFRFSEPIADCLLRSIESQDASFESKVSRLYLVSDIIYNTTARVPEALQLRTSLEKRLISILQVFGELYRRIEGRLKAEMVKRVVLQVVGLWEKWAAFSRLLCQNFRDIFTLKRDQIQSGVSSSEESDDYTDIDGHQLNVSTLYSENLVDPNIDGDPIIIMA